MVTVNVADIMAKAEAMAREVPESDGEQQSSTTVGDGDETVSTMSFPLPPPKGVVDIPLGLVTASQIWGLSQAQRDRLFQYVRSRIREGSQNITFAAAQDIREQFSRCGVEFLPTPYEIYTSAGESAAWALLGRINRVNQPMVHWRANLTAWLFWLSRSPGYQDAAFRYRVMETLYLVAYFFGLLHT